MTNLKNTQVQILKNTLKQEIENSEVNIYGYIDFEYNESIYRLEIDIYDNSYREDGYYLDLLSVNKVAIASNDNSGIYIKEGYDDVIYIVNTQIQEVIENFLGKWLDKPIF